MQAIRDKMGHHEAVRKAHNFKDIRRSGNFSGQTDEPLPPFRQASVSPQTPLNAGGRASGGCTNTGVQNNGAQSADTQSGAWPSSSAQSIDAQEGSWDNGARDEGISNGGWSGAGTGGYGMSKTLCLVVTANSLRNGSTSDQCHPRNPYRRGRRFDLFRYSIGDPKLSMVRFSF